MQCGLPVGLGSLAAAPSEGLHGREAYPQMLPILYLQQNRGQVNDKCLHSNGQSEARIAKIRWIKTFSRARTWCL